MASKRSCLARLSLRFQRHLRRCLHRYVLLLLLAGAAVYGVYRYGVWTAEQLEFNRLSLPQEVLPGAGPLTIALLSDVHDNRELLERCVERIEAEKPDLIIFGGDLHMSHLRLARTGVLIRLLRRLSAVAPTFAILGNQDYERLDQVERILVKSGIRLLRNEGMTWQTPTGGTLRIVGLGDVNEEDAEPERCLPPKKTADTPALLLSHDPESRHLLWKYDWDLLLCGHTHGGQLGNPFTGEVICFRSDKPAGYYQEAGYHIFVTRGVGSIFAMRFFCPPEMNFIEVGKSSGGE